MPKFIRYRLLLDENLPPRIRFSRLNERHNVKHLVHDYKSQNAGTTDEDVYQLACKEKRIIITFNGDDFLDLYIKSKKSGIIALKPNVTYDDIDKKVLALLSRYKPSVFYGKFRILKKQ